MSPLQATFLFFPALQNLPRAVLGTPFIFSCPPVHASSTRISFLPLISWKLPSQKATRDFLWPKLSVSLECSFETTAPSLIRFPWLLQCDPSISGGSFSLSLSWQLLLYKVLSWAISSSMLCSLLYHPPQKFHLSCPC